MEKRGTSISKNIEDFSTLVETIQAAQDGPNAEDPIWGRDVRENTPEAIRAVWSLPQLDEDEEDCDEHEETAPLMSSSFGDKEIDLRIEEAKRECELSTEGSDNSDDEFDEKDLRAMRSPQMNLEYLCFPNPQRTQAQSTKSYLESLFKFMVINGVIGSWEIKKGGDVIIGKIRDKATGSAPSVEIKDLTPKISKLTIENTAVNQSLASPSTSSVIHSQLNNFSKNAYMKISEPIRYSHYLVFRDQHNVKYRIDPERVCNTHGCSLVVSIKDWLQHHYSNHPEKPTLPDVTLYMAIPKNKNI